MSDLAAAFPQISSPQAIPNATPASSLDRRLESALRAALGLEQMPVQELATPPADHLAMERIASPSSRTGRVASDSLPALLLAWHEQGILQRRLAALSSEQIDAWHARLRPRTAAETAQAVDQLLYERIESFFTAHSSTLPPQHASDAARSLQLVIEAAAHLRLAPSHVELWRILDRVVPTEPWHSSRAAVPTDSGVTGVDRGQHSEPSPGRIAMPPPAATAPAPPAITIDRPSAEWDVKIACALPFVILGPLARLGYLDALAAVLEGANLTEDAHLFAVALAYKVLDPPQRGWRRTADSLLAAATFAGLRQAVPETALVEFARRMAPHTGALDITLSDALIAEHTPGEPVTLLSDSAAGLLLFDTQGCFPIGWTRQPDTLIAMLKRLGLPLVLVAADAATPRLLSELHAAGIVFVVDVPPARGENWTRIQQGTESVGWTNFAGPTSEALRHAAAQRVTAWQEAREFSAALLQARPGIIRATSPELDRSLTLAAGVALGMISWKLWQSRGRTTPQLLMERYADLEGRVRFNASRVHVALPLGRRHRELDENRFLSAIDGVPWLAGRRVEFGGG